MGKYVDVFSIKVYVTPLPANNTALKFASEYLRSIKHKMVVDGESYNVNFYTSNTNFSTYKKLNTRVFMEYENLNESDLLFAAWPWDAGVALKIMYAVQKKKPILVLMDNLVELSDHLVDTHVISDEKVSLLTPLVHLEERRKNSGVPMLITEDFSDVYGFLTKRLSKYVIIESKRAAGRGLGKKGEKG